MSDTNRTAVGLIREAILGVLPNNPVIKALRFTGTPNLAFTPQTVTSNEINEDAQVSDLILVGGEAGGDLAFELSHGSVRDEVMEAALRNVFALQPYREGAQITSITANPDGAFSNVFTADAGTDQLLIVGHGLVDGDGPFFVSNVGGGLPAGLAANTPYWVNVIDADNIELAASKALALVPTPIDITTNGTGVNTLSGAPWALIETTDTSGTGGGAFAPGDLVRLELASDNDDNDVYVAQALTTATHLEINGQLESNVVGPFTRITRCGRIAAAGDITATTVGGTALLSTVLDFTTLGLAVGHWIKIGDGNVLARRFGTAGCNVFARVGAISANRLDIDAPAGFAIDNGAGKQIYIGLGDHLHNGVILGSFDIERRATDHDPETVELFTGWRPNTFNLQLQPKSIMTGVAQGFALDSDIFNPVAPGDYSNIYTGVVTRVPKATTQVLNTSSNVGTIRRGGQAITGPNYVLEASLEVNNNLRRQPAVGVLGDVGLGSGEFAVTGNLSTYFGDKSILEAVLNNTETSFDFTVRDNSGRAYTFDLPRVKYATGASDVPGKNQDRNVNITYQALRDETLGWTMGVQRFHYAA